MPFARIPPVKITASASPSGKGTEFYKTNISKKGHRYIPEKIIFLPSARRQHSSRYASFALSPPTPSNVTVVGSTHEKISEKCVHTVSR